MLGLRGRIDKWQRAFLPIVYSYDLVSLEGIVNGEAVGYEA